jgi:hypothetical protein
MSIVQEHLFMKDVTEMNLFLALPRAHKPALVMKKSDLRVGDGKLRRTWAPISERSHSIPKVRVTGTLTLARICK